MVWLNMWTEAGDDSDKKPVQLIYLTFDTKDTMIITVETR